MPFANNIEKLKALAGLKVRISTLRATTAFQTKEILTQYGVDFPALGPALADVDTQIALVDTRLQQAIDATTVSNAEALAYGRKVETDSRAGLVTALVADAK